MNKITSDKKYLVIGDPIEHTLSPVMQNAAFDSIGLGNPYGKLRVCRNQLQEFCDFAKKQLLGFNVTVPHKQNIIPFLDVVSEEAKLAQSVNTVVVKAGKLYGHTTDGIGLEYALHDEFGINLDNKNILFIGAGGAVKASAWHFAKKVPKSLAFCNRTKSKLESLIKQLSSCYPNIKYNASSLEEPKLEKLFCEADIVIQGTSLGLLIDDPSPVNIDLLNPKNHVFDLIYHKTALLQAAELANIPCVNGCKMLLYQGAKAFELWTGERAPIEIMLQKLNHQIL